MTKQRERLRLNDEEAFYLDAILQRLRQFRFLAGERTQARLVDEVDWLDHFISERRRSVSRRSAPNYDTLQERDIDRPGLIERLADEVEKKRT